MANASRKEAVNQRQFSENQGQSSEEMRLHYGEFTQLLIDRRSQIIGQIKTERAHVDEQLASGPGDDADISVTDTSADYFLNLANAHQRELVQIRDALDRINRGVYGVCESCGDDISLQRLRHLPLARLCIDCQSAIENTRMNRRLQNIPKL